MVDWAGSGRGCSKDKISQGKNKKQEGTQGQLSCVRQGQDEVPEMDYPKSGLLTHLSFIPTLKRNIFIFTTGEELKDP